MTRARSSYTECIRKCKLVYDNKQTDKLITARYKNSKMYWNMLKSCAGISNSNISVSTFEHYFKSINNPNNQCFNPDEDTIHCIERYENNEFNIMFADLNLPINQDSLSKAIKQLGTGKSGGPDMYINEFFIHGKTIVQPYLLNLFNKIFELGYFPES